MRIVVIFLLQLIQSSVIGIDFGAHWLKVSIIRPGALLETVLNRESKRKTNSILTVRDGIRYFGFDAVNLGLRFPDITFSNLKDILGKSYDNPVSKTWRDSNPNNMIKDKIRGTCNFLVDGTEYRVEELVAMLLAHAKQQAEIYANLTVSGAVITVPPCNF
jgi:hypoxia up-regulated 1